MNWLWLLKYAMQGWKERRNPSSTFEQTNNKKEYHNDGNGLIFYTKDIGFENSTIHILIWWWKTFKQYDKEVK